jgi:chromosome segregation ATPase
MEAFEEIKKAREEEARIKSERQTVEQQVSALEERIRTTQFQIAELGEEKGFFGLGVVKKSAREKIARKELEIREAQDGLGQLTEQVKQLDARKAKIVDVGEFADEKQKLRELLDISTDEHRERQKALVDTALGFVNTAKSRIGQVRGHLGKMNGQVDNLFSANNHMASAYAILNEGIKVAEKENQDVRAKLVPPSNETEEDMITKMKREQQKMDVEDHIARLDSAATDTMATYADLTSQTIRIKDMRDANTAQIDRARSMHTQGIAAVADRLSTVLQAVSSAALGESSAMAKNTLSRVNDNTNKIAMKESIRVAMGLDETNQELAKAIEDLGAYGEVVREGTKIQHQSIAEMREKLDELQKVAKSVSADIQDSVATHANVALGVKSSAPGERPAVKPSLANPFRSA